MPQRRESYEELQLLDSLLTGLFEAIELNFEGIAILVEIIQMEEDHLIASLKTDQRR